MGYDMQRFEGDVDEELICPICTQVLEEPVQVYVVQKSWHVFDDFKVILSGAAM